MAGIPSVSVVDELEELLDEISTCVPNVPGKNRLLRGCRKELNAFQQLPRDQVEKMTVGSNLPYFKAITRLARSYADRLVGLLCRFRMPPSDAISHADDVSKYVPHQPLVHCPLSTSGSFGKPGSVSVDLICIQKRMDKNDVLHNTTTPDCWAPSLWIKALTRDATRLNSAWRGDVTQGATCLYRQTEELVSTAAWYQRGQPPGWIQVLIHWLPSKNQDISHLDSDLVESLTRVLRVQILMHTDPWYPGTHVASLPSTITLAHSAPLSVRKYLLAATRFRRQMCTKLLAMDCATTDDRAVLVKRFTYFLSYEQTDVDSETVLDEYEEEKDPVIRTPLDAVLHRACVVPFGGLTPEQLEMLPRINLDVSALIAMVSELSQFMPKEALSSVINDSQSILQFLASSERREQMLHQPRFASSTFDWLLEAESEQPVLLTVDDYLKDSLVIVCRTAVNTFLNILTTVAGPAEWTRGIRLLTHLVIVPDLVSSGNAPSASSPNVKLNNRQKSRLTMDVGNAFGALTVTSNSAFLRSLRNEGLKYSALLLPARALTESAARIGRSAEPRDT
ncbi:hypothetical protein T265_10097 [Opisthorchis viverrini]|uniref:DUF1308 domain-containing protein n=1 Tax=Opisthorchis viverrini TaxID=6198 RepID=A0A074ZEH9_OPIVI|nr:hypothetical protein T265_10097 [Opisthorchis viverrini]KER21630.1 hypothetical protein T265_10097 [Opisthorchis viverrini]